MVRVAINGFGRIGRLAFRQIFEDPEMKVVAINDLTDPKMLAHLLKYDSSQGAYRGHEILWDEDSITVDGVDIPVYKEPDAHNLPWKDLNIDVVLECTGFYTSKSKSQAHIDAGAKKVLISAPAGNDLPTIVYGVNHETLTENDNIVSGASCTDGKSTQRLSGSANRLHDHDSCVYRRSDAAGRSAPKRRSSPGESRSHQYCTECHRGGQSNRSGYSGTCGQADRFCAACPGSIRLHHDSGRYSQGHDGQRVC